MAKRDSTAEILANLARIGRDPSAPDGEAVLRLALGSPVNVVVARAAELVSTQASLVPALEAAFERFTLQPGNDQWCQAKEQIVLALSRLREGSEILLLAVRYVQSEYGSIIDEDGNELPADGAADLRSMAVIALAQSEHPLAKEEGVRLLLDKHAPARRGAIQALAAFPGDDSALVLRYKALLGDRDPGVESETYKGLLTIDPRGLVFVTEFLASEDLRTVVLAALALGESGREEALRPLIEAWRTHREDEVEASTNLLLAIAMLRLDDGVNFLLEVIRDGDSAFAYQSLQALSLYRHDETICARIRESAEDSGVERLTEQAVLMFPER